MSATKISADPSVTSPADTDVLPIVADGVNSKMSFSALKAFLLGAIAVFGASGASAAKGLVPSPGAAAGTARFLREDATWAAPPASGGSTDASRILLSSLVANGLVLGSGKSPAVQIANGTKLQAAANAGRIYDDLGGAYIEHQTTTTDNGVNVGLQFPFGFEFVGGSFPNAPGGPGTGGGTTLIQFAAAHPAMTLGKRTLTTRQKFYGGTFGYGVDASAQTGSAFIAIGQIFNCQIDMVQGYRFASGSLFLPYDGWKVLTPYNGTGGGTEFSNEWRTVGCDRGARRIFSFTNTGTGDCFSNIYLGGGGATDRATPTGSNPVLIQNGQQSKFDQLNIEWITANSNLFVIDNQRQFSMDVVHYEGCKLTGFSTSFLHFSASFGKVESLQFYDMTVIAADTSGNPTLLSSYGTIGVEVNGLEFDPSHGNGSLNRRMRLFSPDTSVTDALVNMTVRNIFFNGFTPSTSVGFDLDVTRPSSVYGEIVQCQEYVYRRKYSVTKGAKILLYSGQATQTIFGRDETPMVVLNTPLTADRSLKLEGKMMNATTGAGSAVFRRNGDIVTVCRTGNATGAFNLNVLQPDGTTVIASLSGAGAVDLEYSAASNTYAVV